MVLQELAEWIGLCQLRIGFDASLKLMVGVARGCCENTGSKSRAMTGLFGKIVKLFVQERYLRFCIMNLAKPHLKLFETTQKPRQYLWLVRYFWQGFEELNHVPQLFRFNPDLMPASGIEIGEVCGLFDELFTPLFERCSGKVFDRFLRLRLCTLAPISFLHPTKEIDKTHP